MPRTSSPPRPLAHVHLPDFPAWAVVQSGRPGPAVVTHRGRVVAATRDARYHGVLDGMAQDRAHALVPGATVAPRDGALEAAVWEHTLDRLNALTPFLEPLAPGEAVLADADPDALRDAVTALRAQAGVAPARGVAHVAALEAAPGHVLHVETARVTAFLGRTPVAVLARLAYPEALVERLGLLGYPTLGAARALTKRHLAAQFGDDGARLYALLHPGTPRAVPAYQPPPSVRAELLLDEAVREPGQLQPLLHSLAEEIGRALTRLRARRLTLTLGGPGGPPRVAATLLREATADAAVLARAADALLQPLLAADRPVEEVILDAGALQHAAVRQGALFRDRPQLYLAARGVQRRFPGALFRATVVAGALFPEDAVRLEPVTGEAPPPRRRSRRSVA